jgi:uncharacterized protein (TIGR03067 family)
MRTALVACFAFTLAALAAPVPKAVKKADDAALLEGKWQCVSLDTGGGPQPDKRYLLVANGTMSMTNDAPSDAFAGPLKLNADTTPKEFDVTWKGWTQPQRYIYQLDGDTLTMCHAQDNQPRPTELKGSRGGACCFVFKRMKE